MVCDIMLPAVLACGIITHTLTTYYFFRSGSKRVKWNVSGCKPFTSTKSGNL